MCVTRGIPNRQYPTSGQWIVAIIVDSVTWFLLDPNEDSGYLQNSLKR